MATRPMDSSDGPDTPFPAEAERAVGPAAGVPVLGYAPRDKTPFGHSLLAAWVGPAVAIMGFVSIVASGIPEAGHDRIDSGRGLVTGLLLAMIAAVVSRFAIHLPGGKFGLAASAVCLVFVLLH